MTVAPCCEYHQAGSPNAQQAARGMAACCDWNDCGPCCEDCPTCPTVVRMRVGFPTCDQECGGYVRAYFAEQGIEVTVSHLPPLVPERYEPLGMRCPHGVLWHCEPTSDQQAAWTRAGVE